MKVTTTVPFQVKAKDGTNGSDGKNAAYITVSGRCHDGSTSPFPSVTIYDGAEKTTKSLDSFAKDTANNTWRGLTMMLVNRQTLEVVGTPQAYDTYGGDARCTALANAINAASSDNFVILVSYDATSFNADLIASIKSCGGRDIKHTGTGRYPFAFVGYRGLQEQCALQLQGERQSTAPATVMAYIADGTFMPPGKDGSDGAGTYEIQLSSQNVVIALDENKKPKADDSGTTQVKTIAVQTSSSSAHIDSIGFVIASGAASLTLKSGLTAALGGSDDTRTITITADSTKTYANGENYSFNVVANLTVPDGEGGTTAHTSTKTISITAQVPGAQGPSGYNTAVVELYKDVEGDSQPSKPSVAGVYTFATQSFSVAPGYSLGGWQATQPSASKGHSVWKSVATAYSQAETDPIAAVEWSDAVRVSGSDGTSPKATYCQTVKLYKRSSSLQPPDPPSATMYYFFHDLSDLNSADSMKFAYGHIRDNLTMSGSSYIDLDSNMSSLNGWSLSVPSGTAQCWETFATALAEEADSPAYTCDAIGAGEWSAPTKAFKDGAEGRSSFTPEIGTITLSTNSDGSVKYSGSNSTTVKFYYKGNLATITNLSIVSAKTVNVSTSGISASISESTVATIMLTMGITTESKTVSCVIDKDNEGSKTIYYPKLNGALGFSATVSYGGVTETVQFQVLFVVEYSAAWNEFYTTNSNFVSAFYSNKSTTDGSIEQCNSRIDQTAKQISLTVDKHTVCNSNMLNGTFSFDNFTSETALYVYRNVMNIGSSTYGFSAENIADGPMVGGVRLQTRKFVVQTGDTNVSYYINTAGNTFDMLTCSGVEVSANSYYNLSFYARSNRQICLQSSLYLARTQVCAGSYTGDYYDGDNVADEDNLGTAPQVIPADWLWHRVCVTFKTAATANTVKLIIARLVKEVTIGGVQYSTDLSTTSEAARIDIAGIKFEKSRYATDYPLTDILLPTGINITDKTIEMTANRFTLRNNLGEKTMGVDSNGNVAVTGTVHATDGEFTGTVHATDGDFSGTIKAAHVQGVFINTPLYIVDDSKLATKKQAYPERLFKPVSEVREDEHVTFDGNTAALGEAFQDHNSESVVVASKMASVVVFDLDRASNINDGSPFDVMLNCFNDWRDYITESEGDFWNNPHCQSARALVGQTITIYNNNTFQGSSGSYPTGNGTLNIYGLLNGDEVEAFANAYTHTETISVGCYATYICRHRTKDNNTSDQVYWERIAHGYFK